MLRVNHLSLYQFRNYTDRSFHFKERVIGIFGKNGIGKTNLLDAIYYLCFTRSYFSGTDAINVMHGQSGFRIEGTVSLFDQTEKAVCLIRENGRKEFSVDTIPYDKFSRHIGRYPCVVVAPDDARLITGESRERRGFMDAILCQTNPEYVQELIAYKKILDQRNSLLRTMADHPTTHTALLDVLDEQLVKPSAFIFSKRKEFLESFIPSVKKLYREIAGPLEQLEIKYDSELLQASITELLRLNRAKDFYTQRTVSGIHRDELVIQLQGRAFKSTASQGQRKSLLFALKLAEAEALSVEKKFPPLLLLDDVFEKLDSEKISNLLVKVCRENSGQVFITDTNEERLDAALKKMSVPYEMLEL